MALTKSIESQRNGVKMATGRLLEGSSAVAIDVNIGFIPRYVIVWNEASGDQMEWNEKMADAEAFKRLANGTGSLITSNGITPLDNGVTLGFKLGLDADVNVVNEQMSFMAME